MSSLSRRTLVRGAVWSVPAISFAAAAPAFALSNQCGLIGFTVTPSGNRAVFNLTGLPASRPVTLTVVSSGIANVNPSTYSGTSSAAGTFSTGTTQNANSYVTNNTYTVDVTVTPAAGPAFTCRKSFTTAP